MTGISLDLSKRNTGYAIWGGTRVVQAGSHSFQEHVYFGDALLSFQHWLTHLMKRVEQIDALGPDWVAYEEVMVRNKVHGELHFGMVGILAMACAGLRLPLLGVNTMTMKKVVAGTGKASKEQMVREVQLRYPDLGNIDHDVADAIGVGIVAQRMFMKEGEAPHAKVD